MATAKILASITAKLDLLGMRDVVATAWGPCDHIEISEMRVTCSYTHPQIILIRGTCFNCLYVATALACSSQYFK